METLIQNAFGIKPLEIIQLNGYENKNYLVKTAEKNYIFKTYPKHPKTASLIDAECDALNYLQASHKNKIPKPIPFASGEFNKLLSINNELRLCRMLSFLPGAFLGDVNANKDLMVNLGCFLAEINKGLAGFHCLAFKARNYEWDLQNLLLNKKHISTISSAEKRSLVSYFFKQFETNVLPEIPTLRKAFIHSDFNEWNILVEGSSVAGLIDFGDMVYSPLINEVATAICYLTYDKDSFFKWATPFLKAYHKENPLQIKEVKLLYYLIATKLCISVCQSAQARVEQPENQYASVSEKNAWRALYALLKINPIAAECHFLDALGFELDSTQGVDARLKERRKYLSSILSVSYNEPIFMHASAFQYMYDGYGNTFLDAYNNIPHVGHGHPRVVEAGQKQLAKLNTNTRYLYDLLPKYADKLLSKFPKSLDKVFFVNSGSEANDLAIRMAQKHTGNKKIMVLEHGYHGHTQTGIDISDYKFNNPKGQGQKSHILKVDLPGEYHYQEGKISEAGSYYADKAIDALRSNKDGLAAFIAEPIVGCGGQVPLAPGYLKALYPEIRKQGGVCISDEVQTGFGRLGSWFWGFEMHGVVPDIVVLGKPMGNGHPIGAVVTSSDIAASFSNGVEFFSSFGGNPVSCAIGLSVLETIEEEALQERAKTVGSYYKNLLKTLQKKDSRIGDVRGEGLFLGIALIDESGKPNRALAQFLKNDLRKKHILISTDGPQDSVIKTKPPLVFTQKNALHVAEALRHSLKHFK